MNVISCFLEQADKFPDKTAIFIGEEDISYSDLAAMIRRTSGALHQVGVKSGSHIGLLLHNSIEFVTVMLAAADLGATIVPLNSSISYDDFKTAINTTDINYVIGWHAALKGLLSCQIKEIDLTPENCISVGGSLNDYPVFSELLDRCPDEYRLGKNPVDVETDFILTMTSGSTSAPKPIVFTQGTKIRRCNGAQELYGITSDEVILVATPLYHSISQRLVLLPLLTGATSVIMTKFTVMNWLTQVEKYKVTFTIAISSQLENILSSIEIDKQNLSSLRCVVSCCAFLKPYARTRLIEKLQCDFHECYGASELGTISNIISTDALARRFSVGVAVPGAEIMIVDEDRNQALPSTVGEISCKSVMLFSRYYNNKQATKNSMLGDYFLTGDMGYLDDAGYLYFSGRKKEIIISGGTNIYPKDIEIVLNKHPSVEDSAVISVDHDRLGEAVLALILLKEDTEVTVRELQHFCLHRLADYQQPLKYKFLDDFPRSGLGKVLKQKLVEAFIGEKVEVKDAF
jgi:long-chain acyl-CoA synthetase